MSGKKFISLTAVMGRRTLGVLLLAGCSLHLLASNYTGGDKKKDNHKTEIPVNLTFSNLRNTLQLSLKTGLQPGLQFTGDFTTIPSQDRSLPYQPVHSLMTYQKGNTIFIVPYKQHLLLSKFKTPERVLR